MAAFGTDQSEWQRLDFRLLQNGPIALYYQWAVLEEDLARLRNEGYAIDEFDCAKWQTSSELHTDVAARLVFPEYYGRNLDAFNDCMGEIEIPNPGGRAIVFRRFDLFAQREPRVAQVILDVIANASWRHLLFGRRLLTIAQSDDPRLAFATVGAQPVMWNPREWFDKNRGL